MVRTRYESHITRSITRSSSFESDPNPSNCVYIWQLCILCSNIWRCCCDGIPHVWPNYIVPNNFEHATTCSCLQCCKVDHGQFLTRLNGDRRVLRKPITKNGSIFAYSMFKLTCVAFSSQVIIPLTKYPFLIL